MIQNVVTADSLSTAPGAYVLSSDVVLVLIDDRTGRLLDLGGTFYALSAIAAEMLQHVLNGPLARAASMIATCYGEPIDRVAEDLTGLLADLEQRGLIRPAGVAGPRIRLAHRLAATLLPSVIRFTLALPVSGATRAALLLGLANRAIRLFGWPATVAAWRRLRKNAGPVDERRIQAIDEAVRRAATRHVLNTECKERGLVCWLMLRAAGVPARLVVGIDLYPFSSHCWCEVGGKILTDFAEHCERYTPVACYA
jgi:hypothetical protein